MFNQDKREAGAAALRTEVDRLGGLPLAGLAAEIMARAYGPGRPGADGSPLTGVLVANEFISDEAAWSDEDLAREQLVGIVAEGIQVLEHACLVRQRAVMVGTEHVDLGWTMTRYGETSLAGGTVAQAL